MKSRPPPDLLLKCEGKVMELDASPANEVKEVEKEGVSVGPDLCC